MIKERIINAGSVILTLLGMIFLMLPYTLAGPLEPTGPPTGSGSEGTAMYTLEDLYNRLDNGTTGTPGGFGGADISPWRDDA